MSPRRRGKGVALGLLGGLGGLVLVVVLAGVVTLSHSDAGTAATTYTLDLAPDAVPPSRNPDPSDTFSFPISYDLDAVQVDGRPAVASDAVGVYLDPFLHMPAPVVLVDETAPRTITVQVYRSALSPIDPETGDPVNLSVGGLWGFSDRYYIAEFLDPATGVRLPEPRVTPFTVQTPAPATSVVFEVDAQGVGQFAWDPVDGAQTYYIVGLEKRLAEGSLPDRSAVRILGSTTATTWSTIEDDTGVQRGITPDASGTVDPLGVARQNAEFATFLQSDDERHYSKATEPQVLEDMIYGVIAMTPEGPSPLSVLPEDIAGTLPITTAQGAKIESGASGESIEVAAHLPTGMPVTMSDGRTVLRPLHYDVDGMTSFVAFNTNTGEAWERFYVPYTVDGTLMRGRYAIDAVDLPSAQADVRTAVARVQEATVKNGAGEAYVYVDQTAPFDPKNVATTAPVVPYPINGTNPLTTYLAANLVAGAEYIDLSDYLPVGSAMTTSGISYQEALQEALEQNPYILGRVGVTYNFASQILRVSYPGYATPAERVAEQELLAAEIAAVTARIITPGMGDRDKVLAINSHLSSTAEYNYDALNANASGADALALYPRAWTASGVLLEKTGVCASYAKAFTALADAAGLESMYVTGVTFASAGRHAWNKVRVDGAWRVVDATWNDSVPADQYLLLTDVQSAETRTEDTDWVVDARVGDYAAN